MGASLGTAGSYRRAARGERAGVGRAAHATHQLCGYVQSTLDRGALALRQGNRAAAMDRATSDLDRYLAGLVQDGA